MNILFTTDSYSPQINGIVFHVLNLKKELEKRGHKVYVVIPKIKGKNNNGKEIFSLPAIPFMPRAKDMLTFPFSPSIEKKISKINFDIVHNHTFLTGYFGLSIAKKQQIPSLVTFHTLMRHYVDWILPWAKTITHPVANMVARDYFGEHNLVIAPSKKAEKELQKAHVKTPIKLLNNGITTDLFKNADTDLFINKFFIDTKRPLVTISGVLEKGKNVDLALKGIDIARKTIPNIQLAIIGDGKERKKIENMIIKLGLQRNAFITGFLSQKLIASANKASDLILFTSDTDTFPTVIVEALFSGKPIVAVKDMAIEQLVHHEVNGIIVPKNPLAIGKAITALLSDKKKQQVFSRESLKMSNKFSLKNYVDEIEKIYLDLINKNHS